MTKVVKFGGSSLANALQFRKVAEILAQDSDRKYVIVSAPGKRNGEDTKVTDLLYQCYEIAEKDEDFSSVLQKIKDRYQEIIDSLSLKVSLEEEFAIIEENFKAHAGSDYAASRGEYLNGILMSSYLQIPFIDMAKRIYFREDGFLDEDKTYFLLSKELKAVERAVIPGFYGTNPDGSIKTFSRGGSDVTGSIIAHAVHADAYENWTDVSGFLIADPRIVPNPPGIKSISYQELRELSYMGASVLHEDAVFPVRSAGIPINIRNTNAPIDAGTWIREDCDDETEYKITGIAGKKNFVFYKILKDRMCSEVEFNSKVVETMKKSGISAEYLLSDIDAMTILISDSEYEAKKNVIGKNLSEFSGTYNKIDVEEDVALIAVVGRNMRKERGTVGRIIAAIEHARIPMKLISQGGSGQNIIIGVSNVDFERAIRAIYEIFVELKI